MIIGFDAKRIFHNWRGLGNYGRNILDGLQQFYPENKYVLFTPNSNKPVRGIICITPIAPFSLTALCLKLDSTLATAMASAGVTYSDARAFSINSILMYGRL